MKNILVATDLSEYGDRAIQRAVYLSELFKAKLNVIYVIDDLYNSRLTETISSMAEQHIKTCLQTMLTPEYVEKVNIYLVSGQPPYMEIVKCANTVHADCTVIGMHRKQSIELFVGTTADRVSRYNTAATLLSRNENIKPYRQVLYATDFSSSARRALKSAIVLAPDAEFIVSHFTTVPSRVFLSKEEVSSRWKQLESENLTLLREEAASSFASHQLAKVKYVVEDAAPQQGILDMALQQNVDLIVLGKRNRGGFNLGGLNSVSLNILSKPPCDILVVKA